MKSSHMLLCALLLVIGVVLFASGGGSVALVPLVVCMGMMGVMMWMMIGAGRHGRGDR